MDVLKGVIDIGASDSGLTTVTLNMYLAASLAAVLFWLGNFTVSKVKFLEEKCIPSPLVGGLYFALINTILTLTGVLTISFDETLQSFFMMVFFCTVGFTVSIPILKSGGRSIIIMLVLGTIMILLQNFLGGGIMMAFRRDPRLGVAAGSTALIGGPGTAAAFGATMDAAVSEGGYGMGGTGTIVGVTSAIYGLVMGSIMGGPTAYRRIKQYNLKSTDVATNEDDDGTYRSSSTNFTKAVMFLAVAIGIGQLVSVLIKAATGLTFPGYIGAMLVAAVIRNIVSSFPSEEVDTIGDFCLNLFLAMAMVGLKLWLLIDLALPLIVTLILQALLMFLFSYYIVFNVMGKSYNAAVQTAGFIGFAMGTTSNAMANMQAITKRYGSAREAYFVIPMVGSLFIDFINAALITVFLNWMS